MGTLYEVSGTTGNISSIRNYGSTQWNKAIASTAIANGDDYNLSLQFDPVADKVADGTTTYDEMPLSYGIDLDLTGTSGTANINVDSVNYLATFDTDLATTASAWVAANKVTLKALGVNVNDYGSGKIRFCATEAVCNAITISNVTGNLAGSLANGFTGGTAAPDHFLQPYAGKAYENQRIQYNIRVNLNIDTGSTQTLRLGLRRFKNDSLIGSTIPLTRNQDDTGQQVVFITYTANADDPFVDGGFYFLLENDSGGAIDIDGKTGFLIQYYYQYPTHF